MTVGLWYRLHLYYIVTGEIVNAQINDEDISILQIKNKYV